MNRSGELGVGGAHVWVWAENDGTAVAAVEMWKSRLIAISKDGGKGVKTCLWFSSLSTARNFHRRPRGQVRLLAPRRRILTGDSTHGKQRRADKWLSVVGATGRWGDRVGIDPTHI